MLTGFEWSCTMFWLQLLLLFCQTGCRNGPIVIVCLTTRELFCVSANICGHVGHPLNGWSAFQHRLFRAARHDWRRYVAKIVQEMECAQLTTKETSVKCTALPSNWVGRIDGQVPASPLPLQAMSSHPKKNVWARGQLTLKRNLVS